MAYERTDWQPQRARLSEGSIAIRSRDRTEKKDLTSNFTLEFGEKLQGVYVVKSITLVNSVYHIDARNDRIWISPTVFVSLAHGNYTGTAFATELQTKLQASGGALANLLVQWNDKLLKIEWDNTTIGVGATLFTFHNASGSNSALQYIGFSPPNANKSTTDTYSLVRLATGFNPSPGVLQLSKPLSLGIRVKQASTAGYETGGREMLTLPNGVVSRQYTRSNASLIIPFIAGEGVYQITTHDTNRQFLLIKTPTRLLNIVVVDPTTNREVQLNGSDWEALLEKIAPERHA